MMVQVEEEEERGGLSWEERRLYCSLAFSVVSS